MTIEVLPQLGKCIYKTQPTGSAKCNGTFVF